MNYSSFQTRLEQLHDLVVRMKASIQWQKLSIHETMGNAAFGRHFYEDAVRERDHLNSQFTYISVRMRQELLDSSIPIPENSRMLFLKKLYNLQDQIYLLGSEIGRY
jgi:hypothetical protein